MGASTRSPGLVLMSDEEFRRKVSHEAPITLPAFKIATAVLFAIALTCFIGRLSLRVWTRRRLYLDDGFLIFSAIVLCTATGLMYQNLFHIFLLNSMGSAPELMRTTAFLRYANQLQSNHATQVFTVLTWTTIYSVKATFFAFFKPLIQFRQRLTIYYWISIAFTILSFGLSASAVFVLEIYEKRAFASGNHNSNTSFIFTLFVGLGDIISDIMIVSIPILLLRNSTITLSTKIGVGSFLSLSVFMMTCMIIRAAGYSPGEARATETVWRAFWQQTEACVGIMMASVTVFRKLLASRINSNGGADHKAVRTPSFVNKGSQEQNGNEPQKKASYINLPKLPSATFGGIRSLVFRSHHENSNRDSSSESILPSNSHHAANGPRR